GDDHGHETAHHQAGGQGTVPLVPNELGQRTHRILFPNRRTRRAEPRAATSIGLVSPALNRIPAASRRPSAGPAAAATEPGAFDASWIRAGTTVLPTAAELGAAVGCGSGTTNDVGTSTF